MHKTHPCSITGNLASLPFTAVYVSSGVIKCTLPFHGIVHPLAFIAVSTGKSRFTITMFMVLRPVTCKVRGEELWQMWENAWNDDNELTKWWQRWRSGSTVDFLHFLSPRWVQDHTFATPGRGVTLHFYMVFRELIKLSHHANWRHRFSRCETKQYRKHVQSQQYTRVVKTVLQSIRAKKNGDHVHKMRDLSNISFYTWSLWS